MTESKPLDSLIWEFEQAWRRGDTPDIGAFLRRASDKSERHRLLVELIGVDLEYRWRAAASNSSRLAWNLTDYLGKLDDLRPPHELPRELIEEEYRVRHRWGDRPSPTEFAERYEGQYSDIRVQLARIDVELRNERDEVGEPMGSGQTAPLQCSAAIPDARTPLLFSDYLLQEMIGAGRFGRVYRAWQHSLARPVALKYLRKSFQQDPEAVEQFINEARTVAQLQHPGIVSVHGVGKTPGGGYFIAMDHIDGCDLAGLTGRGQVSVTDAVKWMVDACEALGHAHERGIIHCDLKPANLLLDEQSRVRVTDFGLARSIREEARPVDRIQGTCGFMAPEQISGWWGAISPRTDVYGLGAVLFNLLTGEPPYRGATLGDVLAQVVSGVVAPLPQELRPDVPRLLNEICVRSLSKSPPSRFEDMRHFATALREALATLK
jgi:eukaryotic-like serine/threonine-protein kinase